MQNHNIILITPKPLKKEIVKLWYKTVCKYLPNGVHGSDDIIVGGHLKQSNFYSTKIGNFGGYVVPLTRDLSLDEAGLISVAFNKSYNSSDYTIDFSQATQSKIYKKNIKEHIFNEVAYEVAKRIHNEWINTKVLEGWNYGPKNDRIQRKNPNMLPWEQCSKKLKDTKINEVYRMLEILESINFKIVRKIT
jgi:hypothetical protein